MSIKQLSILDILEGRSKPKDVRPADAVTLRPYQVEASNAVYREWESGNLSTLVSMPTGTGKSVLFSDIMRRHQDGRIILLAHREELIYQGVAHAKRAGLTVGIEMGNQKARHQDVIVSSIQTQIAVRKCRSCFGEGCDLCDGKGRRRRMTSFRPRDFGLVVIDEGHHATAKSYRMVMKWYRQNPLLRTLLVTATPERADGVGMHNAVDSCAYEMDIRQAISEGWLCPIRQAFVTVEGLDLSEVGTKAGGDLADGELEQAIIGVDEQRQLHSYVKPALDEADGKQLLFFAPGCKSAEMFTAAFNAYPGVTAELVLGTTDKEQRRRIIERYRRGETQVLVGVGVPTEGFDVPAVSVVAIARPTKSESLYRQMIGRATRPLPGIVDGPETDTERRSAIAESDKPVCTVLDFVGNSGRHKLISVADVLAGSDVRECDLSAAVEAAKKSGEPVDMENLVEKAKQAREERAQERRRKYQTTHRADRCEYTAQDVDPFGRNRFAAIDGYNPGPTEATEKQVRYLVRLGVDPKTSMGYSKRQAGKVIDEITNRTGEKFVMPFGKYAGRKLADIPRGYLQWAANGVTNQNVQSNINAFLNQGK